MSKKKSQLERAIENLEAERAVLDLAIVKLRAQLTATATKPKKQSALTLAKEGTTNG